MNTNTLNKKILVTGGAGFIGSHVCEKLLDQGFRVVSVDNFNNFYSPEIKRNNIRTIEKRSDRENFISIEADIRDREKMFRIFQDEKPDAVIHLAAMAGVRPSIQNPLLYTEVNILGTQNLLDACVHHSIRHFVFASSSSVYGNNEKVPFAESDNVDHPISPYAATKKAGELFAHTYAHLFNMAVYCLRFFTVYGPRQRPDLAIHKFTDLISRGQEIPFYGEGGTERDYTYIEDIAAGILRTLELNFTAQGKSYEVFNLGGSQTVSLNEMVSAIEHALKKKAKIQKLPEQAGDVKRTSADIRKSSEKLGYMPATPFRKGVAKFVAWFNEAKKEEMLHDRAA